MLLFFPLLLAAPESSSHLDRITRHLDRLLDVGLDRYGPDHNAMWLASIDLHEGGQYAGVKDLNRRVYRRIHAPRGSTLYWDQPLVAVACAVSDLTGEPRYRAAAEAYVADFLGRCVSPQNGLFLWGNHQYWDVFEDRLEIIGTTYHEIRPLMPIWELFRQADEAATLRCVRALGEQHLVDPATGKFDRHGKTEVPGKAPSDRIPEAMPFLEAGGTLVESLAWLAARHDPPESGSLAAALQVARFSYEQRGPTGLLPVQPGKERWDSRACTTEVGLWAGCLLRASELTGEQAFVDLAAGGVTAYLEHGWDDAAGKFYGMLSIADGQPVEPGATRYQPRFHADPWEPLFPSHDYPMSLAEACLDVAQRTGEPLFRRGAERWVTHLEHSLPVSYPLENNSDPNRVRGTFAAEYGRAIHFLWRASREFELPRARVLAEQLATEATAVLWSEADGMYRGHPGEDCVDAVDGLGLLFAALIALETGREPELMGFHF